MVRYFQFLGIIVLVMGSFFYSERVSTTSLLSDNLLTEIKDKASLYSVDVVEASVTKNTIIPGKNGSKVNVNKSYKNMKEIGYFDDKMLVYDKIVVKNPLSKNTNKYIVGGNSNERAISLVFVVSNGSDLTSIVSALNDAAVRGTFFVTSDFMEDNNYLIMSLISSGHTVGNLGDNGDYSSSNFVWMKTMIVNSGQKYNYCYVSKENRDVLNSCNLQKSYTIMPTEASNEIPYIDTKKLLHNGSIISYKVNGVLSSEIENIINYVVGRGYKIESLEKLLKE